MVYLARIYQCRGGFLPRGRWGDTGEGVEAEDP